MAVGFSSSSWAIFPLCCVALLSDVIRNPDGNIREKKNQLPLLYFHFNSSLLIFFRYGKIQSAKAILDKTTNKCKGQCRHGSRCRHLAALQHLLCLHIYLFKWLATAPKGFYITQDKMTCCKRLLMIAFGLPYKPNS